ncbi:MAG: hypothetical protein OXN79_10625, partial [bacterium]|nr:hypothetical protein [bacterium]
TVNDYAAEPDGSVTVAVSAGSGYTVSPTQGTATAAVADSGNSGSPDANGDISLRQLLEALFEGHWFFYESGPGCTSLGPGRTTGRTVYKCPDI